MSDPNGIPECNDYRVLKPCTTCPFIDNGKKMHLNNGRVEDIKKLLDKGGHFVCHKTAYDLNNSLQPANKKQPRKMCAGAYEYIKSQGFVTEIMMVAIAFGMDENLIKWYENYIKENKVIPELRKEKKDGNKSNERSIR